MKKLVFAVAGFSVLILPIVKMNYMIAYLSVGINPPEYTTYIGLDFLKYGGTELSFIFPFFLILFINIVEYVFSTKFPGLFGVINSLKTIYTIAYLTILVFITHYINWTDSLLLGAGYLFALVILTSLLYIDDSFVTRFIKGTKITLVINVGVIILLALFITFSIMTSKSESTLRSICSILEVNEESMIIDIGGMEIETTIEFLDGKIVEVGKYYRFGYHSISYGFYFKTIIVEDNFR